MTKSDRREFLSHAGLAGAAVAGVAVSGTKLAAAESPAGPGLIDDTLMRSDVTAQKGTGTENLPVPSAVQQITVINLRELEGRAEKVIPRGNFDYIAGAAGDEWTMAENEAAYKRVQIAPRYLTGNGKANTSAMLMGAKLSMPVMVSAVGGHGIAHTSAEVGTAKGAAAAGVMMTVPTLSNVPMEEIAAASDGPKCFQVYFPADKGAARDILTRAKALKFSAAIITVDAFVASNRERNMRNHYRGGALGNFADPKKAAFKEDLNWDDVAFVRETTGMPVYLKGVLTPAMAKEALAQGVSGLQISNHGGRQLDDVPASFTALPAIADAVGGKMTLIVDGGVRRGQDVFKALAMGANAVGLARPYMYGLALGGWMGVQAVFDRLHTELVMTMQLAGASSIAGIKKDALYKA
jgi:isopentenyl diphosphate isomerase/L-lactate dehydrogenase-like FMN-dependent dehydrogenase